MRPLRLTAAWALPGDGPPIPDAAVLIGKDGRIAATGPAPRVDAPADARTIALGSAILLPGLVNTHTHLELTGLEDRAPTPEAPFRDWILAIRRLKQARSPEEFLEAARRGVRDCWAAGMTTVADTGDSGAVVHALAELGGSGVVYHEVFGPHPEQVEESFAGLRSRVAELAPFAAGRVRLGVSPHAPYTVSGPLYARVAGWAAAEGFPVAVHLAESREETEFVTRGAGPFAEAWRSRGIPLLADAAHHPPPTTHYSPVDWLDAHGILGPSTLCIHAVELVGRDIALLAERGVAIAHCPLSNDRHGHRAAPLAALRAAGLRVGLGTDSVASVGRLDLLGEARAARALAGLGAEEALALGTREGARALGLEREIGSLTPGKWGDVIAVHPGRGTPGPGAGTTPEALAEAVLSAGTGAVTVTVLGGRVVHRAAVPAGAA
ncbi:MAG TPA: amidohydrolase family protein [Gemmatimonadales bacterium]|jgi:5-methylthioadenosine/S-adenosylhomocysteine deaminase|nr:amidohydrolase family protein [Gemmatimonadales bacterium]